MEDSNEHPQRIHKDVDGDHSYSVDLLSGQIRENGKMTGYSEITCKSGETLGVILDFKESKLKCYKLSDHPSDSKVLVLCNDIRTGKDLKYRLSLSLYWNGQSVTVTSK